MAQSIGKARGQIAYSRGEKLYILDPYVAVTTALPGSTNASVPFDQTIVAVTDGPDAVYVAANSGTKGYIYKTTFDATTGVVNGLTLTAVLPEGEKLNSIAAYVNTYLILTTESGFRVGTFTGSGVQYGPNLLTVDSQSSTRQGFGEITFYGSRAYLATLGPAHPGTLKQRLITRQFLCFNSETDKSGQIVEGDTSALDRLTAVRQMCQRGDTVTLQDLVNNISDQVIIDDYQFT